MFQLESREPEGSLSGLVRRFHAYAEDHAKPVRRREPPSGLATLVINLGPTLHVEHPPGTSASFGPGGAFFAGLHRRYAVTETSGAQVGVQVMLTPAGARRLARMPLQEVGDGLIDPASLFGGAARELADRLQEAQSHAVRLEILTRAMQRLLTDAAPMPRDLQWAMDRLQASRGRFAIGALSEQIGCSRRFFIARFRNEFGITPKLLARILRFDHARSLLRRGCGRDLAELAAGCGYADQSHLAREFRDFAGYPPSAFMRHSLPEQGGVLDQDSRSKTSKRRQAGLP